MRHAILFASVAFACVPVQAEECRVLHPVAPSKGSIAWDGACRDGLAEGPGVILLTRSGEQAARYEVTLARGEIVGEGILRGKGDALYAGTFQLGLPHGYGFFRYGNGAKYEGEVAHGRPEGQGTWTSTDGTRYTGGWKAGRKEGRGRIDYALGGSYDGEWAGGAWNGRGVLTYAGSGRRVEGMFHNGVPVAAPQPAAVAASSGRYAVKEDAPRTGTNILHEVAISPVPPDKAYADLTPEQQAVVRNQYTALAPGDEPPYPLNGPKALYAALSKALVRFGASGDLKLLVRVGADGQAQSVTAIGAPTPDLVRFASTAVMLQRYKPAMCDGQPCEMIYPVSFRFELQ